jgi:uncharacterized membrane protein YfcA
MIILCLAAFGAGFIDAIIGGGGLIQTPTTLVTLPQYPVPTLLGTTKIPSIFGTSIATIQYALKVQIKWKLMLLMCSIALPSALIGSMLVSKVNSDFIKPVILIMLVIVFVYTFTKKNFGIANANKAKNNLFVPIIFSLVLGFYDGFIGPGTGSFLAVFFISLLGFDFLKASAHAKMVNISTNLGSIIFFGSKGFILWQFAIPMAIFNFTGSILGAKLAILKGNKFIKTIFLIIIAATIARFAYDIFFKH